MKKNLTFLTSLLILLLLFGCAVEETTNEPKKDIFKDQKSFDTDRTVNIPVEASDNPDIMVTKGGVKYLVHPDKILRGGPVMDGIPSIDEPLFITVKEADEWIEDNELVLAMIYKGTKRVYPLQVLVWHEIVNDKIAGDPVLITYCPLCGSGIAFERKILVNGAKQEVEFGTSGKLYNSNLVMYDRETRTYWTQIEGRAIIGELTGQKLIGLSIDTVVWRDWKKEHPDSEVLDKKTGYLRPYGTDPYGNYYEDSFLLFPVDEQDSSVHPKEVIFGIEVNGEYKAYKESDLNKVNLIEDFFAGVNLKVEKDSAGTIKITNLDSGEEIVKERDFWFAWYAFHPETVLYFPPE
jgi:hypothetical protein